MTVSGNAVNLQEGYYLVSYGVTGTQTDGINLSLNLNGSPVSTLTNSSSDATTLSKTIVVNATGASTLTLTNSGTQTLNATDAYITAVKLT